LRDDKNEKGNQMIEFVTIKEICAIYNISVPTLRKYIRECEPPLPKFGRRFSLADIKNFMHKFGVNLRAKNNQEIKTYQTEGAPQ
jgi:hypothetical protein